MNWLTIDPGISGTGWAYFNDKNLKEWGIIYPKGKTFVDKSKYITTCFSMMPKRAFKVFCEWPSFQNIVAQNTGSIIKLAFLIGVIHTEITELIPVTKWKGQLPKEVTQKRAEKFFGVKGFKSHAADAVGIGQYIIENKLV